MLSYLILVLPQLLCVTTQNLSSKRGLVHVASEYSSDDSIWDADNSDLTWYYNYSPYPTDGLDHSKLDFVPMLWGTDGAEGFHSTVEGLIYGGLDVKHVLGFNEPDGCVGGGSCIGAEKAAQLWKDGIEPLKKHGVLLGAPAVTGSSRGMAWLEDFQKECKGGCTIDFLPVHWYGNFEGMAGYIGGISAAYQNLSTWVTEFGEIDVSLQESHLFFNQSIDFLDDWSYIKRYAYFGSFRSDVSNIGPNAAMLNRAGELTDIGAWYLGQKATGISPTSQAGTVTMFTGWIVVVLFTAYFAAT